MNKFRLMILSIALFVSCKNEVSPLNNTIKEQPISTPIDTTKTVAQTVNIKPIPSLDLSEIGLIDVQLIDSSIAVDLKYASSENFMKKKLYYVINKAYLQKDVAHKLSKAQNALKEVNPHYTLLIYDAARPVSVQQRMWDALDTIPVNERTKFVSNPKNHSIHNYGAAVDLTILDENGKPLDMGAGYDDIRKIAYPRLEEEFLKKGELSIEQIKNRKLLRAVMSKAGFKNIATEWWHFNACDRETAKAKYSLFLEEPKNN